MHLIVKICDSYKLKFIIYNVSIDSDVKNSVITLNKVTVWCKKAESQWAKRKIDVNNSLTYILAYIQTVNFVLTFNT